MHPPGEPKSAARRLDPDAITMTGRTPGGNPLTQSAGGVTRRFTTRCGELPEPGIAGMEAAMECVNTDAAPGMPPL